MSEVAPSDAPRRIRVAVLNTHPIQYFAPLYRKIVETCPDIDLTVLYLSDSSLRGESDPGFAQQVVWDIDLMSGYQHKFVGKSYGKASPSGFWSLATPAIWTEIRHGGYDLLWLHGYAYAANLLALAAARMSGVKVALRAESHLLLYRPGLRRVLRNGLIAALFRQFDWFFAIGSRNADYLRYLGVRASRIRRVPYAIDNERFGAAREAKDEPSRPVVLFAAKMVNRKDPLSFLEAARLLQERGINVTLRMAGSGPMESQLRERAKSLGLRNIEFTGFVNQGAMPALLAAADIFVATSDWEPWGLVVNEAMAAGLAIVASDDMGCAVDLVHEGINGFRVRSGDAWAVAERISELAIDPSRLRAFQRESRRVVDSFSLNRAASLFGEAVRDIFPVATNPERPFRQNAIKRLTPQSSNPASHSMPDGTD